MDNRIGFIPPHTRPLHRAGWLLGFALGGFFDGILLHQILQWHHLLSGVERAPFADLRVQILADGVFHAAMYVVAAAGLWQLLRARYLLVDRRAERVLAADMLIGFGAWHMVDSIVSHWLLGIHRIRMDTDNPMFWDILWFVVFGLLFIAAGLALRRRSGPSSFDGNERRSRRSASMPIIVVAVTAAAFAAALPPQSTESATPGIATATVVLRPGASVTQLFAAVNALDARVLWADADGTVWVLALAESADPRSFYSHGALYVSGTLLPAGCSAWTRTT
jgi:uncharacterized membrane protein